MVGIAYDNSASNNAVSSISQAFTVGTGTNRLLIAVATYNGTTPTATYNGVSMTLLTTQASLNYGPLAFLYLYAPASGANTFAITSSGAAFLAAAWASYSGVSQSNFPDAQSKQDPATPTSPITGSVTTIADNSWTVACNSAAFGAANQFSAGTGETQRQQNSFNSAGTYYTIWLADSNGALTPPGSKSLSTAFGGTPGDVTMIMVSLAPAPVVAGMMGAEI